MEHSNHGGLAGHPHLSDKTDRFCDADATLVGGADILTVERQHNSVFRPEPLAIEGSSLETIRHMVVSGLGITVLPCTAAGAHSYSQRLLAIRRFNNPVPTRTVALAWRVSFPRPKAIDAIKKAVHGCNLSCVKNIKKS